MDNFRDLLRYIYWYSESMHDGRELVDFLIEKELAGPYAEVSIFPSTCRYYTGKPRVLGLIYDIWRSYAAQRVVYLELQEDNFRIHPAIHPHFLVHLSIFRDSKGSRPGVHAAAVGKRVLFNVWDGSNAPTDLRKWTGIVTRKIRRSGNPIEYIVKRDVDGELIKLTRDYLIPLDKINEN